MYEVKVIKNNYVYFLLGLLFIAVLIGAFVAKDLAGWIFVWLTFVPFLFIKELRENKKLLFAVIFIIILHNLASITNAYFYLFPGADSDAASFHSKAIAVSLGHLNYISNILDANFYIYILSRLFYLGHSKLLGQELSVLAFSFSCVILISLQKLFEIKKHRILTLLILGLIPTYMIWGSVELRESLQLLFLLLTIYFGVYLMTKKSNNIMFFIFMLLSPLFMGMFHVGLRMIAPGLVCLFSFFISRAFNRKMIEALIYSLLLTLLFIALQHLLIGHMQFKFVNNIPLTLNKVSASKTSGMANTSKINMSVVNIVSGIFLHSMSVANIVGGFFHRMVAFMLDVHGYLAQVGGNTFYHVYFNPSSYYTVFVSLCKFWVYYLFGPFPWELNFKLNLFIMLYSWFKAVLLACCVVDIFIKKDLQRNMRICMLLIYLLITTVWAFGVNNYGTALRHQMLSDWILVLFGMPVLISYVAKIKSVVFKQ
ncbi:MAG: hypothetical protein PVI75_02210 [Gammaproteobacteria bacterium]|jgi:hypothetical protein